MTCCEDRYNCGADTQITNPQHDVARLEQVIRDLERIVSSLTGDVRDLERGAHP